VRWWDLMRRRERSNGGFQRKKRERFSREKGGRGIFPGTRREERPSDRFWIKDLAPEFESHPVCHPSKISSETPLRFRKVKDGRVPGGPDIAREWHHIGADDWSSLMAIALQAIARFRILKWVNAPARRPAYNHPCSAGVADERGTKRLSLEAGDAGIPRRHDRGIPRGIGGAPAIVIAPHEPRQRQARRSRCSPTRRAARRENGAGVRSPLPGAARVVGPFPAIRIGRAPPIQGIRSIPAWH